MENEFWVYPVDPITRQQWLKAVAYLFSITLEVTTMEKLVCNTWCIKDNYLKCVQRDREGLMQFVVLELYVIIESFPQSFI